MRAGAVCVGAERGAGAGGVRESAVVLLAGTGCGGCGGNGDVVVRDRSVFPALLWPRPVLNSVCPPHTDCVNFVGWLSCPGVVFVSYRVMWCVLWCGVWCGMCGVVCGVVWYRIL